MSQEQISPHIGGETDKLFMIQHYSFVVITLMLKKKSLKL